MVGARKTAAFSPSISAAATAELEATLMEEPRSMRPLDGFDSEGAAKSHSQV